MARINRSDIIQKAVNDLAISTSTDRVPNETLDKVQLTYDLNKKFSSFIVRNSVGTTGNMTVTLPTIDPRSEIYITAITFNIIKDVTCDIADGTIGITITTDFSGVATNAILLPVLTLTAQDSSIILPLPYPIKLKANTNIVVSGIFTAGKLQRSCTVVGFINSSN